MRLYFYERSEIEISSRISASWQTSIPMSVAISGSSTGINNAVK